MDVMGWVKSNPLKVAAGVVGVGVLFMMMNRPAPTGDGGMSAFYAAQAAQKQSGDAVMIAQIQGNVASAGIAAQKDINATWAGTQLAQTQANNEARIALAPYSVQASYLSTIAEIARQPPITQTTSSTKKGIFGNKKTSTTTTVVPNPAWDMLDNFADFFEGMMLPFDTSNSVAALTYNPQS